MCISSGCDEVWQSAPDSPCPLLAEDETEKAVLTAGAGHTRTTLLVDEGIAEGTQQRTDSHGPVCSKISGEQSSHEDEIVGPEASLPRGEIAAEVALEYEEALWSCLLTDGQG